MGALRKSRGSGVEITRRTKQLWGDRLLFGYVADSCDETLDKSRFRKEVDFDSLGPRLSNGVTNI